MLGHIHLPAESRDLSKVGLFSVDSDPRNVVPPILVVAAAAASAAMEEDVDSPLKLQAAAFTSLVCGKVEGLELKMKVVGLPLARASLEGWNNATVRRETAVDLSLSMETCCIGVVVLFIVWCKFQGGGAISFEVRITSWVR
jgi:hypothetical protein